MPEPDDALRFGNPIAESLWPTLPAKCSGAVPTVDCTASRLALSSGDPLPRPPRILYAVCTLPTAFPSLRAHEPNPAGLEIHPDLAG